MSKRSHKQPRWKHRVLVLALSCLVSVPLLWLLVHRVPWLGPMFADGLRAVVGTRAVERLEIFAYGVEDRANRLLRSDQPPAPAWSAPEIPTPAPSASLAAAATATPRPPFRAPGVAPMHEKTKTAVDGVWVPMADPRRPTEPSMMAKTLLHPDASRPWAELFVVAFDLARVRISLVPGTVEPRPNVVEARDLERPGLIPKAHHDALLAAFNGGFKTQHGHYGLGLRGTTVVKARPLSCTIASYADGSLRIATHKSIAQDEAEWTWWRQGPPCVYEDDRMHPSLWDAETRGWGAALGGETVIRRSAVGVNREGNILFVGVSNHTTARAMADGMQHAGASDVAQLDVNWSFPKIVLFRQGEKGRLEAESAFKGFIVDKKELLYTASRRDFFYVHRQRPLANN